MKRKLIGLSSAAGDFPGTFRNGLSHDYVASLLRANATPIILPICDDQEAIEEAVKLCDGIIISGGVDINPKLYHEDIHVRCGEIMDLRDTFELYLLDACVKYHKPVLGICRGIQIINVYFGGSLYQDLPSEYPGCIKHSQLGSRGNGCHQIQVEANSFLEKAVGLTGYVNSYHHQAIKEVANGFKVVARSNDGVIEAIEDVERKIYGVQFHPEIMTGNDEGMLAIFQNFIDGLK